MRIPYPKFSSAAVLSQLIDSYFTNFDGADSKGAEPITLTGLALHLGFTSLEQFEDYEKRGGFAIDIKRARLRIEQAYEKRLHLPSPSGAIFVLKTFGWNEKIEGKDPNKIASKTMKIKMVQSGPKPASNEKEVEM